VLSSSLHGLVIADSLRIPNQWAKLSTLIIGDDYKFVDYYSCFGIENPEPIMPNDPKALGSEAARIVRRYERPGIEDVIGRLIESFPTLD
jgi:pyruvyltransferase